MNTNDNRENGAWRLTQDGRKTRTTVVATGDGEVCVSTVQLWSLFGAWETRVFALGGRSLESEEHRGSYADEIHDRYVRRYQERSEAHRADPERTEEESK